MTSLSDLDAAVDLCGIDWRAQPWGTLSDLELARKLGVSRRTVGRARERLKIPPFRRAYAPPKPPEIRRAENAIHMRQKRQEEREAGIVRTPRQAKTERQRRRREELTSVETLFGPVGMVDLDFLADALHLSRSELIRRLVKAAATKLRSERSL